MYGGEIYIYADLQDRKRYTLELLPSSVNRLLNIVPSREFDPLKAVS